MADASREVRDMQFRKIKADPSSHYTRPDEVISDDRFEAGQKVDILKQWGKDLLKLDPNLAAADRPESDAAVRQVMQALEALGADPNLILKQGSD